jgi:hypothetical protein
MFKPGFLNTPTLREKGLFSKEHKAPEQEKPKDEEPKDEETQEDMSSDDEEDTDHNEFLKRCMERQANQAYKGVPRDKQGVPVPKGVPALIPSNDGSLIISDASMLPPFWDKKLTYIPGELPK